MFDKLKKFLSKDTPTHKVTSISSRDTEGYTVTLELPDFDRGRTETYLGVVPPLTPNPDIDPTHLSTLSDRVREIIVYWGGKEMTSGHAQDFLNQINEEIRSGVSRGVLLRGDHPLAKGRVL
ncbi:hypothetical protein EalM132_00190 [Exiguobacterium phage vB_EalM-132]|nr:hypothetical protein EalM132_00020 [Exiguobacterium phage vB_EalM-132]AYP68702.1 hypothetical protein EalM132_00190 [Exiguobacterium phage vB_EalM-132]